jgi:hypothetical protein
MTLSPLFCLQFILKKIFIAVVLWQDNKRGTTAGEQLRYLRKSKMFLAGIVQWMTRCRLKKRGSSYSSDLEKIISLEWYLLTLTLPGTCHWLVPATVASRIEIIFQMEQRWDLLTGITESSQAKGWVKGRWLALSPPWFVDGFFWFYENCTFFHTESGNICSRNYHSLIRCNSGG